MKRRWPLVLVVLLLAGCGVEPAAPAPQGEAPTGVASGPTLYFVDQDERVQPDRRSSGAHSSGGALGTVSDALSWLLARPGEQGDSGLHSEIGETSATRVPVRIEPGLILVHLPLRVRDLSPLGIQQIVCTALGVHVQGGGSRTTQVQVEFTLATPASDVRRSCPLISPDR